MKKGDKLGERIIFLLFMHHTTAYPVKFKDCGTIPYKYHSLIITYERKRNISKINKIKRELYFFMGQMGRMVLL
jgi:hypothetical protein